MISRKKWWPGQKWCPEEKSRIGEETVNLTTNKTRTVIRSLWWVLIGPAHQNGIMTGSLVLGYIFGDRLAQKGSSRASKVLIESMRRRQTTSGLVTVKSVGVFKRYRAGKPVLAWLTYGDAAGDWATAASVLLPGVPSRPTWPGTRRINSRLRQLVISLARSREPRRR